MDPPNKVTIPGLTLLFGNLHTQPEEQQTNNSTDSPMLDGPTDNPLTTEDQQVVAGTPSPAPTADPVAMAPSKDLAAPNPAASFNESDLPDDTALTAMDTASDDTDPDVEEEPELVVPRRCLRCKNIKKGCSGGIPCDLCTRSGLTADECETDVEYDEAQRRRLSKRMSGAIPNASIPKRSMSPKKRGRPPGTGARGAAKEASAAVAPGTDMSASAATDTANLDPGTPSTTPPDSPPFSNAQLMSIGDSVTSEGDLQTPPSRAPSAAFAQMAIQETTHFQQPSAPVSTMLQQIDSDSANSGGTNKRRATPAKTPRKKAESPTPRATKEKKTNANGDGTEKKPRAPRKRSAKKADPKGVGPNGATPAQGSGLRNEILQDDGSDKATPSTPAGFTQPFGAVGQTSTSFMPGQMPVGSSANAPYYPWVMRPFEEQAGNSSGRSGPRVDSESHNTGVQSPAMPDAMAQIAHAVSMSDKLNRDLGIAGTEAQFSVDVEQEMLRAAAVERMSAIPKAFADAVQNHQRQVPVSNPHAVPRVEITSHELVQKDFQLSADSLTRYKVSDNTTTGEPSNGTGEAGHSVIPSKRNTPPNGDPNASKRPRTAEPQPAAATTPAQPPLNGNIQQVAHSNNQQALTGNIQQAPNGNNKQAPYSNNQQAPYTNGQPAAYAAQQPINQDPFPFPAPLQHSDDPRGHLLTQIVSIADRIHRSHAGAYPGYLQRGPGPVPFPPPPAPVVHALTPSELRALIVFAPGVSISTYARLTPAMAVAAEAERYLWWFQQTFGEEDMVAGLPYDVPPPGHNWARLRLDKPLPVRWSADMRPQGDWPVGGLVE
ncbi:hypothetical protein BFW01_g2039 [Lasiodiplodia theobromae]|nr:hypothetical protein BFW01_g2039 [Lasiodiplodia theobromae]